MTANQCPTKDELNAYLLGELPEEGIDEVAKHLDHCAPCEGTVAELEQQSDTVLVGLRRRKPGQYASDAAYQQALSLVEKIGREASQTTGARPNHPASSPPIGRLREYELLEKLGEGGMGAVYTARHTKLDKIVAIKVLPMDRMKDRQAVVRFEREMRAVGRLDHPNIVRAMDAGEVDGMHFLVMEYVKGLDLSQLSKQCGPLPIADACELIRQAAVGLEEARENGMVHRDIKPSNLMLCVVSKKKPPVVKVLDMGLALLSEAYSPDAKGLTSTGQMMGTIDYMAPEQGGDSHDVDIRADIYSLGASLYKLLCGEVIYFGPHYQTPVQKLMALATQPAPPIQQRREGIPGELAAVLHRMLEKQPASRYATPEEVAQALTPFCAGANLAQLLSSVGFDVSPTKDAAATEPSYSPPEAETGIGAPASRPSLAAKPPVAALERTNPSLAKAPLPKGVKTTVRVVKPPSPATRTSRRKLPPWFPLAIGGALLGLAGTIVLATVFFLQTPNGTLRVEINDASIEVRVKGTEIVLKQADKEEITLTPGEHTLTVKRGDFEFETRNFELKKGETTTVKIDLLPGKVQVTLADGAILGEKATSPTTTGGVIEPYATEVESSSSITTDLLANVDVGEMSSDSMKWERQGKTLIGRGVNKEGESGWTGSRLPATVAGDYDLAMDFRQTGIFPLHIELPLGDTAICVELAPSGSPARLLRIDGSDKPSDPQTQSAKVSLKSGVPQGFTATIRHEGENVTIEATLDGVRIGRYSGKRSRLSIAPWVKADGKHIRFVALGKFADQSLTLERAELRSFERQARSNGAMSSALEFDGKTSLVKIPTLTWDGTPRYTVEAWVASPADPGNVNIVTVDGVSRFQLFRLAGLWAGAMAKDKGVDQIYFVADPKFHNRMSHVAYVVDGKTCRFYENGKLLGHDNFDTPKYDVELGPPGGTLGGLPNGQSMFRGRVDEIRISSVPRYSHDFTPARRFASDADTTALYHCDEGEGDVLHDASGNKHDGKLVGAKWVTAETVSSPEGQGFVRLFNERDLTGWDAKRSAAINWTNENGTITGRNRSASINSAGVIESQAKFKDFHFRCEVLAGSGAEPALMFRNGGQLIRGDRHGYALTNPVPTAPSIAEGWGYGSLYADDFQVPPHQCRLAPAAEKDLGIKTGDWYRLEIIAQGESVEVRVNDTQTVRYTSSDPALNRAGSFSLRCHVGALVAFRNVEIKELPASSTDQSGASRVGSATSGEEIDLLAPVDAAKLTNSKMKWERDGERLIGTGLGPKGKSDWTGFVLPTEIGGDYEVEIEFVQRGFYPVQIDMPLSDTALRIDIAGDGTGLYGLTSKVPVPLKTNVPQTLVARVRQHGTEAEIQVTLDGADVGTYSGERKNIKLPHWVKADVKHVRSAGLCELSKAYFELRRAVYRPLAPREK